MLRKVQQSSTYVLEPKSANKELQPPEMDLPLISLPHSPAEGKQPMGGVALVQMHNRFQNHLKGPSVNYTPYVRYILLTTTISFHPKQKS